MHKNSKKPNSRPVFRWLTHLSSLVLVIIAVLLAFPRLIGSDDDPAYALTVAFLSAAVAFELKDYVGGFKSRPRKHRQIVLAAKEYATGKITLEEFGLQTKRILTDK